MTDDRADDMETGPEDESVVIDLDLCLCGRDPTSTEVREDLIKVVALRERFGLVQGGCLRDAAEAFDEIFESLKPREAQRLKRQLHDIDSTLEGPTGSGSSKSVESGRSWLH